MYSSFSWRNAERNGDGVIRLSEPQTVWSA